MIYRIIVLLLILTAAITYIVITQRKFRRELKAQMEEIDRRQMERMRVDTGIEEAQRIQRIRRWADPNFGLTTDEEKKIEPNKHIKRHSIR